MRSFTFLLSVLATVSVCGFTAIAAAADLTSTGANTNPGTSASPGSPQSNAAAPSSSTIVPTPSSSGDPRRIHLTTDLSLVVPTGWIACDPAANHVLGDPTAPTLFARVCTDPPPKDLHVQLIKPQVGGFSILMTGIYTDNSTPISQLVRSPGNAEKVKQLLCERFRASSMGVGECELTTQEIAGEPAFSGHLVTPGRDGMTQMARLVLIPSDEGLVMLMVDHATIGVSAEKYVEDPETEAMIASLVVR